MGDRGQLDKLISNRSALTVDEREMWSAATNFEQASVFVREGQSAKSKGNNFLEVALWLPHSTEAEALKVWNFNKGLEEADKCAKDVELYMKGRRVWKGQLAQGRRKQMATLPYRSHSFFFFISSPRTWGDRTRLLHIYSSVKRVRIDRSPLTAFVFLAKIIT